MKKFLIIFLCAAFVLGGCGKGSESSLNAAVLEEKSDDDIIMEEDNMSAFQAFFDSYAKSELAESVTKDKHVEIVMYEETDHPYIIDSRTHIQKEKDGDTFKASFSLDDAVGENTNKMDGSFEDGFLYYSIDDVLYKEVHEWDDVRYMIDGYYFNLYEYTVSQAHTSYYSDGSCRVDFTFNLQNLAEAPDEEIFEMLSATGTTYKNLAFNDASFVGYIDADGYVTGYRMYYDGQVFAASDVFTFKYTTTVTFTDINKTTAEIPGNKDDYELVEEEEEESTEY